MPKHTNRNKLPKLTAPRILTLIAAGAALGAVKYDQIPSTNTEHANGAQTADITGGHIGDPVGARVDRYGRAFDKLSDKGIGKLQPVHRAANGDITKVTVVKTPDGTYKFEQTREQRRLDGQPGPLKEIGAAALASDGTLVESTTVIAGKPYGNEWQATTIHPDGTQTHGIASASHEVDDLIAGASQGASVKN